MSSPIVQITLTIATIIGLMISTTLRKKASISRKMTSMASGALMAICTNISCPKVSSAMGRPVMWYCSGPPRRSIISLRRRDIL